MTAERLALQHVLDLDATDPLVHFGVRFEIPEGLVYLDGNSLGPLPSDTHMRISEVHAVCVIVCSGQDYVIQKP